MMGRYSRLFTASFLGSLLALSGCGNEPAAANDENLIAPAGKEDNYFSNVAQEFYAKATPVIELAASYTDKTDAQRLTRARKIMEGRTKQIAWFLHVYLIDKSHHDEHSEYGGLRAMVLQGSYESDSLRPDPENPLRFTYSFKIQVGGTKNLLKLVRDANKLPADADTFELQMAKLSNDRVARFSHSSYGAGDWTPESCNCDVESLPVTIEPIDPSNDGYLPLAKMLSDGVMDISVHFGWDYHARYDIYHSRSFYNWLVDRMGFTSPVSKYEELNRLSGPLVKEVTVNGEKVLMKVSIFRPDPCVDWDEAGPYGGWSKEADKDENYKKRSCPDYKWSDDADIQKQANANPTTNAGGGNLMKDLKDSLKTRDAIIFTGHSGYTYSYALASWYKTSAGDLDPPEIKKLDLPKDKAQLFVISGCDTYHVGEAFKQNPNKLGLGNADVITTTSCSNSGDRDDTKDISKERVGDEKGALEATPYSTLMSKLNPTSYLPYSKYSFFTMYGVYGIDDNPTASPLGDLTKTCATCTKDSDCGAAGNVCVRLNDTEKVCATECVNDSGCGENNVCRQFGSATSGYLKGLVCVPKTLSCNVEPVVDPTLKEYKAEGTVQKNEEKLFEVPVGPTARNIKVEMTGNADADLYTNFGKRPEVKTYSCRPYRYGSDETCSHKKVSGDTLYIMVRGWDPTSDYKLTVTWD